MAEVTKQPVTDNPTPHFPDDILIEIFLLLPVISLFLFTSVCKHWLSLIQNPNFINLHTKRTIKNPNIHPNPILILRTVGSHSQPRAQKNILTFLSDDETLSYRDDVALELLSPSMASRVLGHDDKLHLLGPLNGLFCISDTVDVVVFNPSTRHCRRVPCSPFGFISKALYYSNTINYFSRVGFGFDPVSKDYKVVRFHDQKELDDNYDDFNDWDDVDDDRPPDQHIKVEIFSLSTNSWSELDCVVPAFDMTRLRSHNLFSNGAFHWLESEDDEDICSIFVFDLKKEAFKKFPLPGTYSKVEDIDVYLSVLNKSLALIVHMEDDFLEINVEFEIWVMRNYGDKSSWRRLYDIEYDLGIERPLSFGKEGEFLVESGDAQLASFNLKTRTIKEFQVHGVPRSVQAFRYRESLVSLKRWKRKRM